MAYLRHILYNVYIGVAGAVGTRLFALLVCLALAMPMDAQNNPYKIDNSLYSLYIEATKFRQTARGLELADRMYSEAVRLGDRKAQCLALSVRMFYFYYNSKDGVEFERAVKAMEDKAVATGYRQYYYFGLTNRVNYLVEKNRYHDAFEYVRAFKDKAQKDHDMLGVFYGLNSLAQIHMQRFESGMAIKTLNEALEVGLKYVKDQDMATIYRKLAECYSGLFNYPAMYEAARKGYDIARTNYTQLQLVRNMAFAKMKMHDDERVKELYQTFKRLSGGKVEVDGTNVINREMVVMYLIANGNYKEAQDWLDNKFGHFKAKGTRLQMELLLREGDFLPLHDMYKNYYKIHVNIRDSMNLRDMSGVSVMIFNQKLSLDSQRLATERQRVLNERQRAEIDHANLELAHTKLSLSNASLELDRMKAAEKILAVSNSNKRLETERLREHLKAQKAQVQIATAISIAFVAVVTVVVIAVSLYLRNHRHMMAKLQHVNTLLETRHGQLMQTKERAEADSRAKTAFIQSMDEDIRKPMMEVVTYAELIVNSSEKSMSAGQRMEYNRMLHESTDRMLDIVADVLRKTIKT